MAQVTRIMIHCTGEPANVLHTKKYYRHLFFVSNGWRHWGYHVLIYQDGSWDVLQALPKLVKNVGIIDDTTKANGCKGANNSTIHIAYVGGIDPQTRKPKDTRTNAQIQTLLHIVHQFKIKYNITEVIGHRDWPGVTKVCPCFDARKEYENV